MALALSIAGPASAQQEQDAGDDQSPPLVTLRFTPEVSPAPIPMRPESDSEEDHSALRFIPESIIDESIAGSDANPDPLGVLAELMLLRAQTAANHRDADHAGAADGQAGAAPINSPEGFTLRFEDQLSATPLWARPSLTSSASGESKWEVLPALYLRSGRVYDAGYESIDYADLYAELGVDLTRNTGLWLRYERLRQALGQQREGEQVDADALFLQFELRF